MGSQFIDGRRRFLTSAIAAAGVATLHPQCLRAAENRRKLQFVVVTDTHIGYRDQDSAQKLWARTAAELAQAEGDLVLHLGDVVDGGREAQYPIYKRIRDSIGKPVHEIPGNHDPRDLFAKHIREEIDVAVDHDWLRFLLLNNSRRDSHNGFLSESQLNWIEEQCRKARRDNRKTAVCMHVPAHKNLHPDRGWYVKPEHGQGRLYEILESYQDCVLALMHGHFHNGVRGWNDHGQLHEICFPSALYNLNRKLEEQKAPGYNLNEFRPGYTLVTIDGATMQLEYKPLGEQARAVKRCAIAKK